MEPDELWEEFFEFVENVPSYDEIINYDVWQEFLLEKYNCWYVGRTSKRVGLGENCMQLFGSNPFDRYEQYQTGE